MSGFRFVTAIGLFDDDSSPTVCGAVLMLLFDEPGNNRVHEGWGGEVEKYVVVYPGGIAQLLDFPE